MISLRHYMYVCVVHMYTRVCRLRFRRPENCIDSGDNCEKRRHLLGRALASLFGRKTRAYIDVYVCKYMSLYVQHTPNSRRLRIDHFVCMYVYT